jgi:DNA helicase II / ATP-dependent DNA helicase PcrA
VMYRTNAQSRVLEEAFLHAGLPYKLVGAQRFYGRREIKDLIAYLRLVQNPADEISLTRVINVPSRGIGDKTMLTLRTQAQKAGVSTGRLVLELAQQSDSPYREAFSGRFGTALAHFGSQVISWLAIKDKYQPLALLDRILEDVHYHTYIDDGTEEGQDRWDNVMELRRLAAEYQEQDLSAFLERVALVSDQDTLEGNANVPTLLTLHAAKGLEFPVVFIVGLNDGTLPHNRSLEDPEEMMEERRLFYVGITRAKNNLYLLYSQNRSSYGYSEPVIPSRFLDDIPDDLLEQTQPVRVRNRLSQASSRPERWQNPGAGSGAAVKPTAPRYQPGVHVQHPAWGEGIILKSEMQNGDEILDIFFAGIGLKRVVASLARLEIK